MDRLKVKKKLYAGMGDFARQRRGEEMRKKYGTGNANLDAAAAMQEEAAEASEMPQVNPSISQGISEVASDQSRIQGEDKAALDDAMGQMAEDEEMAKWMAKQRG